MNIRGEHPERLIDLSAVGELDGIEAAGTGLRIGGTATLARIQASPLVKARQPELAAAITRIGSAQVRNAATLAGNVANASPVADGAVALLGLNARLHLASRRGERTLAVEEFYLDYKKTALGCGELIAAIDIPAAAGHCSFIKAGKRVAVDIAGVNSFCQLRLHKGRVASCRVAFGGVAKYPRLAGRCSEFLNGRKLDGATIADAAAIAAAEFAPISDIRGSAAYRSLLVRRQVEAHLEAAAAGGRR
jgi:xanthine dehydrogenase small subunit